MAVDSARRLTKGRGWCAFTKRSRGSPYEVPRGRGGVVGGWFGWECQRGKWDYPIRMEIMERGFRVKVRGK